MKRLTLSNLFVLLLLFAAHTARGQAVGSAPFGLEPGQTPPLQVSGQFQFTKANAPPGQCGCFWMTGGGFQVNRSFSTAWGAVAEVYYGRAGAINGTDEQLSIFNYVLGPRYSYRTSTRYTPYAQALAGASKVGSNYFAYTSNNTYLAVQAGAGVEMYYKPSLALVPLEANWVHSTALNGVNKRQNNLRVGIGVIYRFGPK